MHIVSREILPQVTFQSQMNMECFDGKRILMEENGCKVTFPILVLMSVCSLWKFSCIVHRQGWRIFVLPYKRKITQKSKKVMRLVCVFFSSWSIDILENYVDCWKRICDLIVNWISIWWWNWGLCFPDWHSIDRVHFAHIHKFHSDQLIFL